jgi:hypothetical protein
MPSYAKGEKMSIEATLFKKADYTVKGLLQYIDDGLIGLPDIQRPFVWSATKVRDLFDSMFKVFQLGISCFKIIRRFQTGLSDRAHQQS